MTLTLAATRYLMSAGDAIGHKVAFFGKVNGSTAPDSAGYKIARLPGGLSSDGVKYPRKEVRVVGISNKVQWNTRIWIRPLGSNPTLWEYVGVDAEFYSRPEQVARNVLDPKTDNPFVHFRNVTDGKLFVAKDASGNPTLKLASYDEPYINATGTLYSLGRGESTSDSIDLTSYVPASNIERLVLIYTNPTDNSDGVVSGDTRTISGASWTTSDIQALVNKLPHQHTAPREVWRLADSQTYLRRSDFVDDLRQVINIPTATGFPTTLSRNWLILANHQVIVQGEVSTGDYQLITDGELILQ